LFFLIGEWSDAISINVVSVAMEKAMNGEDLEGASQEEKAFIARVSNVF
jgi:hypothetical protein